MEAVPAHDGAAATSEWPEVGRCEAEAIRRGDTIDVQIWASQMDEILDDFGRDIDEIERSVNDLARRFAPRQRRGCVSDRSRLARGAVAEVARNGGHVNAATPLTKVASEPNSATQFVRLCVPVNRSIRRW
jgi:hypothetical protein